MPWFRLDDNFDTHPKLVEVGPQAACVFVRGLCYSNRDLTDGVISKAVARELAGGRTKLESALVAVGLWHLDVGGYRIHDFLDFQPSRADVLEVRAKKAAAGHVGGVRSGEVRRGKVEAEREAGAKHGASSLPEADAKWGVSFSRVDPGGSCSTTDEVARWGEGNAASGSRHSHRCAFRVASRR